MSDLKREISKKYNVLTEDGVALRGLFIVDKEVGFATQLLAPAMHCSTSREPVYRRTLFSSFFQYSLGYVQFYQLDLFYLQGMIQHATINNLSFGRSVEETLRTLQAVQYVQENPDEVCPAGWKPGDVTMKPDPKKSKEYFSAI